MDAKTFYKNLKRRDRRALRQIVQVLKEYHPIDVFAIDKSAERHHHKKYKDISLLLKSVNTTSYILSLDKIREMKAKIYENEDKTIDDKLKYAAYVTDTMIKINYHRTKIRLFYTINDIGVSPKISL
ncbi:MAG: hypothetical protein KKE93_04830 [Nanoarchaeota archaeon]|nr:hypothetical protein [Nanoarchaeota archaeon]